MGSTFGCPIYTNTEILLQTLNASSIYAFAQIPTNLVFFLYFLTKNPCNFKNALHYKKHGNTVVTH